MPFNETQRLHLNIIRRHGSRDWTLDRKYFTICISPHLSNSPNSLFANIKSCNFHLKYPREFFYQSGLKSFKHLFQQWVTFCGFCFIKSHGFSLRFLKWNKWWNVLTHRFYYKYLIFVFFFSSKFNLSILVDVSWHRVTLTRRESPLAGLFFLEIDHFTLFS